MFVTNQSDMKVPLCQVESQQYLTDKLGLYLLALDILT